MIIGIDVYMFYGAKNSKLGSLNPTTKGLKPLFNTGIILSLMLAVVAILHHYTLEPAHFISSQGKMILEPAQTDLGLYVTSLLIAVTHIGFYLTKVVAAKK
jgi:hypothetical protein